MIHDLRFYLSSRASSCSDTIWSLTLDPRSLPKTFGNPSDLGWSAWVELRQALTETYGTAEEWKFFFYLDTDPGTENEAVTQEEFDRRVQEIMDREDKTKPEAHSRVLFENVWTFGTNAVNNLLPADTILEAAKLRWNALKLIVTPRF